MLLAAPGTYLILDNGDDDLPEVMRQWRTAVAVPNDNVTPAPSSVTELAQLWELHKAGAVTREEYEHHKARLLGDPEITSD
jgi:hypothetical protein